MDEFQAHLDAHPDDWEYRLIYADWLEEQGDPFCETQRWMADNRKRPFSGSCICIDSGWVWWCHGSQTFASLTAIFNKYLSQPKVKDSSMHRREYTTRHAAERDLHNALVKAGEITCEPVNA